MARFFKLVALKRMARTLRASQIKPVPPGQELGRLVAAYNQLIERVHPS